MKYFKFNDTIYSTSDIMQPYVAKKDIVDAGYLKVLPAGSICKVGERWLNYYGYWVSIIDKDGRHYDVRPNEVKDLVEPVQLYDTIIELCDFAIAVYNDGSWEIFDLRREKPIIEAFLDDLKNGELRFLRYGVMTDGGMLYQAEMNEKGNIVRI